MLILTRKLGESIAVGRDIKITLLDIKGKQVRIGIEAPPHVAVHRQEIFNLIREQNMLAANHAGIDKDELLNILDELRSSLTK